jgi:DNA repair photolyase
MLNKQKPGNNMYGFITHTWNPIKGICSHKCKYCYAKEAQQMAGKIHLDTKCLKDNLGKGKFIFVGSSTDIWNKEVNKDDILKVLNWCAIFPENTYLFQTKNPIRFSEFKASDFPEKTILATTIETNRNYEVQRIAYAPDISKREQYIYAAKIMFGFKTMITVEPILDFDLDDFSEMLIDIKPDWINIGADSKNSNLNEPNWDKISDLIVELKKVNIKIIQKSNLERLKNAMPKM